MPAHTQQRVTLCPRTSPAADGPDSAVVLGSGRWRHGGTLVSLAGSRRRAPAHPRKQRSLHACIIEATAPLSLPPALAASPTLIATDQIEAGQILYLASSRRELWLRFIVASPAVSSPSSLQARSLTHSDLILISTPEARWKLPTGPAWS